MFRADEIVKVAPDDVLFVDVLGCEVRKVKVGYYGDEEVRPEAILDGNLLL